MVVISVDACGDWEKQGEAARINQQIVEMARISLLYYGGGCFTIWAIRVGWAKRLVRRSSKSEGGSVPTTLISAAMVGTARRAFAHPTAVEQAARIGD